MDTYKTEAQQALNKIFTRIYEGDNGEVVVVVGTREHCGLQQYVETEFVFKDGELVQAHIGTAGLDFINRAPQVQASGDDLLKELGL